MLRRHIPNSITSMNLLCGLIGVIFAFRARLDLAFLLMLAAAVCDFLDGFAARLLKAYSALGKELDSLADMVSFGVLPSVMMYQTMRICTWSDALWCYIPLLIAVFSALRLAKVNLDERQGENFLGLATPASAMLCGSLCYHIAVDPDSFLTVWAGGYLFLPLLSLALCALLVCEIPMFSLKIKKGQPRSLQSKRICFAACVCIIGLFVLLLKLDWSLAVLLSLVAYVLMNLIFRIFAPLTAE